MGLRSDFRSCLKLTRSSRVAGKTAMGILTRPKLIAPFQMDRMLLGWFGFLEGGRRVAVTHGEREFAREQAGGWMEWVISDREAGPSERETGEARGSGFHRRQFPVACAY